MLAATALPTFTACTDDDEPAQLAADMQQLTFTITDSNGYASAEAGTRAEENGYATVFTDGESIVKDESYSSTETASYFRSYSVRFKSEEESWSDDYSFTIIFSGKRAKKHVRAACAF